MTPIIVDTHALLWWLADDPALSDGARAAIADRNRQALVSVASLWEIAIKLGIGKLRAPDNLPAVIEEEGFEWLSVAPGHAWAVHDLPAHHQDPFDRMLIAQARSEDLPVVTSDRRFDAYEVTTIW